MTDYIKHLLAGLAVALIVGLQSTGREPEGVCRDGSLLYITSHEGGNNNFNLKLHVVDLLQTNLE